MRVIVPYTNLRTGVVEAIRAQGYEPECIDTSRDDHAYFEAIKGVWEDGEDFIIVEHDVVVPAGSLDSLASCPEPWCGVPYETPIGMICALGCTKYSSVMMETPFFEGFPFREGGVDRRGWRDFDRGFDFWLEHHVGHKRHSHDEFEAEHRKPFKMFVTVPDYPDFNIYSVIVTKLWEGVTREDGIKRLLADEADALVLLDPQYRVSQDAIRAALADGTESEGMVLVLREGL